MKTEPKWRNVTNDGERSTGAVIRGTLGSAYVELRTCSACQPVKGRVVCQPGLPAPRRGPSCQESQKHSPEPSPVKSRIVLVTVSQIPRTTDRDIFDWICGPILQPGTYRNALYLLLGFPLGLIYFVFLTVSLSIGAGLLVIFVGVPILMGTFKACGSLTAFERNLARSLLNVDIPAPADRISVPGLLSRTGVLSKDPATWRSLTFLLARFPFGIASFILLIPAFALSVSLIVAPLLRYILPDDAGYWVYYWQPDSVPGTALLSLAGFAALIAVMHLINGMALGWKRFAWVDAGLRSPAAPIETAPTAWSPVPRAPRQSRLRALRTECRGRSGG